MRFVVLRHERGADVHWDLLLEVAGREGLVTFQIRRRPEEWVGGEAIEGVWLADHRRVYLTYEGEISGGRGRVTRWDGGEFVLGSLTGTEVKGRLRGGRMRAELWAEGSEVSERWSLRFGKLD